MAFEEAVMEFMFGKRGQWFTYRVYRRTVNNHGGFGSGVYCILNIGIHHKVTCLPTKDCKYNLEHMIGAKGAGDGIRAARGTETESAKKRRPKPDSAIS